MARRIAVAAALCALAAGIPATSALAHEGNPDYESLVRAVTPPIPGFTRRGAQRRRPPRGREQRARAPSRSTATARTRTSA